MRKTPMVIALGLVSVWAGSLFSGSTPATPESQIVNRPDAQAREVHTRAASQGSGSPAATQPHAIEPVVASPMQ